MSGWRKPKCSSGKVAFRSQGDAQRALDRIARGDQQAAVPAVDAPSRAYRCGCGAWHLTSQAQRETRAGRDQRSRKTSRRRRSSKAPARSRVLALVPAVPRSTPDRVTPARAWDATDPITEERRDQWRRHAEELARLNAEERLRPGRAAA